MSQGKTTHAEFLDTSSLPLDEIMKSDSNGLSKEERSIQDLAHYLSCPTPPTSHKDNMMIDDKGNMSDSSFNVEQSVFHSLQEMNQVNMTQMCCPDPAPTFGNGSMQTLETNCSHPSEQQQFIQHSFVQSMPGFQEPAVGSGNATNIYSGNSTVNPPPIQTSVDQGHLHTMSRMADNDIHFFHDGQASQYHPVSDTSLQFRLQPEFADTSSRPFQNVPESETNFQSATALSSSFPAHGNQVHYTPNQDNLGYSMMDVNTTLLPTGAVDSLNQFKAPEKMHVDEPDGLYHQAAINSNNNDYFHFKSPEASSTEADMQTYHSENCQQTTETSSFIPVNSFTPLIETSSNNFSAATTKETVESINPGFESNNNMFPSSSMSSSFESSGFITNANEPYTNVQPTHSFQSSNTDCHFSVPQSTGLNEAPSPEFPMQSSPSPNNSSFVASHGSQYIEQPVNALVSPSIQQTADTITNCSEFQRLTKQSMETSRPMDGERFQQISLSTFNTDDTLIVNPVTSVSSTVPSQETIVQQQNFTPTSLPSSSYINFSPSDNVTMHQDLNGKSTSDLTITEFPNPSTAGGLNHFHDDNDAFPHLDIQAVVTGNFPADPSLSSIQHSSVNIDSTPQSGIFGGYPFENNPQVQMSSTNCSNSSDLDFPHQDQLQMPAGVSSTSFLQNSAHSSSAEPQGLYHLQTDQFSSTKHEADFKLQDYPQPMQVHDSDFTKKIPDSSSAFSFHPHRGNGSSLETAMDISSSSSERSISYEDIHRSIVKAGNSFTANSADASSAYIPMARANNESVPIPSSLSQQTFSDESNVFYDIGKSMGNFHSVAETPTSQTSSSLSSTQVSLSTSTELNSLLNSSLSNTNETVLSGLFSAITSQSNDLPVINNNLRSDVIPNFLDQPAVTRLDSRIHIPDHLEQPMKLSESQTGFIDRDTVGNLDSSTTLIPNTTLSHANVAHNTNTSTSQEQNRNSIAIGQNLFQNPLLISSSFNPISVPTQSQFIVSSTESGIAGRATNISMPVAIQIPSNQLDSKATIINQELNSHLAQKPRFATIVIPSTLPSSANDKSQQRNITEELQRLLAQQTLSHHSYTGSQQQTTLPQTLVLQKPTSSSVQWLKQNQTQPQPKLLIKGPLFASQTRPLQPQQQLQQTREKLLIVQQTSQLPRTMDNAPVENQKILPAPFQLIVTSKEQQPHVAQKLQLLQPAQVLEQQPKIAFQMRQSQLQTSQNLVYQIVSSDQRRASLPLSGQLAQPEMKQQPVMNTIFFTQFNPELQQLKKQQEQEKEDKARHGAAEVSERSDRQCSDSIKKEYKHLHSLLTGDSTAGGQTISHIPVLNLANNLQGNLQIASGSVFNLSTSATMPTKNVAPQTSAPFSFLPMNAALSLPPLSSSSVFVPTVNTGFSGLPATSTAGNNASAPLFHLAFPNTFSSTIKPAENKDLKSDAGTSNLLILPQQLQNLMQSSSEGIKTEGAQEPRANPSSTPILLDRKRSHTPLSVDIHSPNSNSEAPSPLSSPVPIEDGNTQATLIERSADLQIKSDTMQGVNDDDENASFFDINSFHKRPSTEEVQSPGRIDENVPMKILKGSLNTDARSSVQPPLSPELAFDIGSVVSTASNFSFAFGSKEDNSEIFTFGSGNVATSTTESLKYKSGSKPSRPTIAKTALKSQTMIRASLPTQQVRPVSRKQKEYSLKAYYPSKVENMELKILEQPETHHRARYQTEGSRGAIKDGSQQGFPVIKLVGYNKPTKLQVFIGDECGRVKPHGFYQACRVFGKNSTTCTEQEIEGTTVIDVDILPENNMTVKLDCIGILKLRNADVERRIGPKRARDKKKNNTRARLVLRTTVEKSDGSFHVLQAVSNPIVCTQPVGQPEICRMSISESAVTGGDSLFIIGKNFKNKGTSVLFQMLDSNDEVVMWQAEAEIEQEFFQPTHLICKVPAFKNQLITKPEEIQIVVSCAGKKSDPQTFTYKPIYQVSQSVKHEVAMETDAGSSSKPLPFVSPEALHLNKMVQESSTNSSLFQLPPGTLSTLQASPDLKPSRFPGSAPFQEATKVTPSAACGGSMSSGMPSADLEAGIQTFLLDSDGPASGSENRTHWTSPSSDTAHVSVHKNSDIYSAGSSSYSISRDSPMILSANSGQNKTVQSTCLESALSSKPIVVVLDTGNLQSDSGTKIQQLLQQILEAQSKK